MGYNKPLSHGIQQVGKEIGEDVRLRLKCSKSVVDPSANNVKNVKAGQGKEELMENVSQLWSRENQECQKVSGEAQGCDDRDKDAIAPEFIVQTSKVKGSALHADI